MNGDYLFTAIVICEDRTYVNGRIRIDVQGKKYRNISDRHGAKERFIDFATKKFSNAVQINFYPRHGGGCVESVRISR